jgi:hypothetical protein
LGNVPYFQPSACLTRLYCSRNAGGVRSPNSSR